MAHRMMSEPQNTAGSLSDESALASLINDGDQAISVDTPVNGETAVRESTDPVASNPAEATCPTGPSADVCENDTDEIEQYMKSLLERVGGGDSKAYVQPAASNLPEAQPSPAESDPAVDLSADDTSPPDTLSAETAELEDLLDSEPRTRDTVRPSHMAALRDLANRNARLTINVHDRKRLINRAYGKLVVAMFGIGASSALFAMSSGGRSFCYVMGLIAMGIAVAWSLQYALVTWRLSRS